MGPFVCVPFRLMTDETIEQIIASAKKSQVPPPQLMVVVLERELSERKMKARDKKKGGK